MSPYNLPSTADTMAQTMHHPSTSCLMHVRPASTPPSNSVTASCSHHIPAKPRIANVFQLPAHRLMGCSHKVTCFTFRHHASSSCPLDLPPLINCDTFIPGYTPMNEDPTPCRSHGQRPHVDCLSLAPATSGNCDSNGWLLELEPHVTQRAAWCTWFRAEIEGVAPHTIEQSRPSPHCTSLQPPWTAATEPSPPLTPEAAQPQRSNPHCCAACAHDSPSPTIHCILVKSTFFFGFTCA